MALGNATLDAASASLAGAAVLYLTGLLSGALARRLPRPVAYAPGAMGSLLALVAATVVLGTSRPLVIQLGPLDALPAAVAPRLQLDRLGAAFLLVLAVLGMVTSAYRAGRRTAGADASLRLPVAHHLFLLAQLAVLLAGDVLTLSFAWAALSTAAWALVTAGRGSRRAWTARRLLALGLVTGLALGGGLLLLAGPAGAGTGLGLVAGDAPPVAPGPRLLAMVLVLGGLACAAALGPVAAALPLGKVTPTLALVVPAGLCLVSHHLVRAGFAWLGPLPAGWWVAPLLGGALFLLRGSLAAVVADRLHGQLAGLAEAAAGAVFVPLALAFAFSGAGLTAAASFALTTGIFLALSQALGLAGLGLAGAAIADATGSDHLDRLGGLARPMPGTAAALVAAAWSVTALPPLGGFIAGWMSAQTLLLALGASAAGPALRFAALLALVLFALAIAAQLTAVVKLCGLALCGRPAVRAARGPGLMAGVSLAAPPVLGLALALFAGRLVADLGGLAGPLVPLDPAVTSWRYGSSPDAASLAQGRTLLHYSSLSVPATLSALVAGTGLAALPLLRRRRRHATAPWSAVGETAPSAAGFTQPVTAFHAVLYLVDEHAELVAGESAYLPRHIRFVRHLVSRVDLVRRFVFRRLADTRAAARALAQADHRLEQAALLVLLAALLALVAP